MSRYSEWVTDNCDPKDLNIELSEEYFCAHKDSVNASINGQPVLYCPDCGVTFDVWNMEENEVEDLPY